MGVRGRWARADLSVAGQQARKSSCANPRQAASAVRLSFACFVSAASAGPTERGKLERGGQHIPCLPCSPGSCLFTLPPPPPSALIYPFFPPRPTLSASGSPPRRWSWFLCRETRRGVCTLDRMGPPLLPLSRLPDHHTLRRCHGDCCCFFPVDLFVFGNLLYWFCFRRGREGGMGGFLATEGFGWPLPDPRDDGRVGKNVGPLARGDGLDFPYFWSGFSFSFLAHLLFYLRARIVSFFFFLSAWVEAFFFSPRLFLFCRPLGLLLLASYIQALVYVGRKRTACPAWVGYTWCIRVRLRACLSVLSGVDAISPFLSFLRTRRPLPASPYSPS